MNILIHDNVFIRQHVKDNAKGDIWFLHGLGESSLCFREGFEFFRDMDYNLYAPDFPGFGSSPRQKDCQTIAALSGILRDVITAISQGRDIHLVGHSMAGLVMTEMCHAHSLAHVKSIVSIDGTLIVVPEVAQRLTSLSPENSVKETYDVFYAHAQTSPALMRYIASLNFTDPRTLYNFAQETYTYSGKDRAGQRYLDLDIPRLYIYGEQSWSGESVSFLKAHDMAVFGAAGGHWPMIDSPEDCYQRILEFVEGGS